MKTIDQTERVYTLKELRILSRKSINSVATTLNVTTATIYGWENGTTQIPLLQLHSLLIEYNATVYHLDWTHLFETLLNKRGD